MARSCCRKVYQHEEDMKVIELEEKHFKTLHTDFCVQAGKFKELAKRVYKSLNILWYTSQTMHYSDSRRALYLDLVIKISVNWYNVDNRIRREYHGMILLSKKYPDTPLRLVLDEIGERACITELDANTQLMWDSSCRTVLLGALKEVVSRASRLLDGDWLIRYYIFFEQANPRLAEYDEHLTIFFRKWMAGTPEDFPVEAVALRTPIKPPHELAFSHVAQLLSSGYLDGERPEPEVLDLSIKKPVDLQAEGNGIARCHDTNSNAPKCVERPQIIQIMNAVGNDNITPAEGNETANIQGANSNAQNYDENLKRLEKKKKQALDNVALAIERVVAKCRDPDEPECVDLTESPVKPKPPAAPRRKRQAAKKVSAQKVGTKPPAMVTADVRRLTIGQSKKPPALENADKASVTKPLIATSMKSVNIPESVPTVSATETRPLAATPNTQGIAWIPTESAKATVTPQWAVLKPVPRRFLNPRMQATSSYGAEHADNHLRLGFAGENGETGPKAMGSLFERLYRPDGPVPKNYGPGQKRYGPDLNLHGLSISQNGPGLNQPVLGTKQQEPSFNQQGRESNQQGLGAKQQGTGLNQQGPGTAKCEPSTNRESHQQERSPSQNGSSLNEIEQLKALMRESTTNVFDSNVADVGQGPACGIRTHALKCIGHLVPVRSQPVVVKKAGESPKPVQSPVGRNVVGSGFIMQAAKRKRQVINEQIGQEKKPSGAGDVNVTADIASSTKLAGKMMPAMRRYVVNGRKPFKEIRPKPTKTPDVDVVNTGATVQPSMTNMYFIQTDQGVHVLSGDNLFKPYKLELQMNACEVALPKVFGMSPAVSVTVLAPSASVTATPSASASSVTGGVVTDTTMQAKKYDFLSRPLEGQESNEEETEDQQLTNPFIKLRKNSLNERDPE